MLDARKSFRPDDPLRALGIRAAPPATVLTDEQREQIAAQLMAGTAAEAVIAELVSTQSVPVATARQEVASAAAHPYVRAAARLQARIAKRDWLLECRARLDALGPLTIARRHRLPAETFCQEHYCTLTPVVLTGLADHWPAMRWSLDVLRARIAGNPEIEIQSGREADPEFELNSIAHKRRMRWNDILDLLARDAPSNDYYVTANNGGINRAALAALWDDIGDMPGYLGRGPLGDGFFWMGPRGTITPWHHDLTQNLLMTMAGTKRVRLVAPHHVAGMRNHRHCFSAFAAVAEPADAPPMLTVDIGPGDILFLPVGWWHHVEGLTRTIGMSFTNFVWRNDFAEGYTSTDLV